MPLSTSGRPAEEVGLEVVHAALDAGVTWLDTANVYCLDDDELGHNELLFSKALKTWSGPAESIVVATKGGMTRPNGSWDRDGRPDQLKNACDRSLRALGVERIDLYQLHAPDPNVPFADSVGALSDLQTAGKIRWLGLSNVSVEEIDEASSIVTVVTVQNRLSPFFREALETGVVAHCAEHGIGFIAYSPVGGGRLNKKLPTHPVVAPMAQRLGASPHAVVTAWGLAQGPTVLSIPAARTVEHAVDAISSAAIELTEADLAAIDSAEFSTA
jgi:aryl-alcohol dehydrogenase-like predicted oxidoreductase